MLTNITLLAAEIKHFSTWEGRMEILTTLMWSPLCTRMHNQKLTFKVELWVILSSHWPPLPTLAVLDVHYLWQFVSMSWGVQSDSAEASVRWE